MANLLKRLKRLRLRNKTVPSYLTDSSLGLTVKVRQLGDGHIACAKCECPFFHAERYVDDPIITITCANCNKKIILELPNDIDLTPIKGEFRCATHPTGRVAIIKSADWLSIGCEHCNDEINFQVDGNKEMLIQ